MLTAINPSLGHGDRTVANVGIDEPLTPIGGVPLAKRPIVAVRVHRLAARREQREQALPVVAVERRRHRPGSDVEHSHRLVFDEKQRAVAVEVANSPAFLTEEFRAGVHVDDHDLAGATVVKGHVTPVVAERGAPQPHVGRLCEHRPFAITPVDQFDPDRAIAPPATIHDVSRSVQGLCHDVSRRHGDHHTAATAEFDAVHQLATLGVPEVGAESVGDRFIDLTLERREAAPVERIPVDTGHNLLAVRREARLGDECGRVATIADIDGPQRLVGVRVDDFERRPGSVWLQDAGRDDAVSVGVDVGGDDANLEVRAVAGDGQIRRPRLVQGGVRCHGRVGGRGRGDGEQLGQAGILVHRSDCRGGELLGPGSIGLGVGTACLACRHDASRGCDDRERCHAGHQGPKAPIDMHLPAHLLLRAPLLGRGQS